MTSTATSRTSAIELVRTVHPTLTHPLTGAPLVSEFTLRGRPVWTAMGGSEPAGGDPTPAPTDPEPAGGSPEPAGGIPAPTDPPATKVWDDPKTAQAEIERLRTENARDRTTARENAATEERNRILKALGLNADGTEEVTVEKLSEQLADKDKRLADQARQIEAGKAIRTHQGDADALGDSRTFATALDQLDPAATDFTAKVDALVKQTITDNPKFKLQARAAGQSGGEFSGGSGEQQQNRPTSLGTAIAGHYRQ